MVEYFINGGPFMWPILILLLAGFGIVGERFYSLLSSSMDTAKFFEDVEESLNNNGVEAALELCDNTEGPLAQIFSAGLSRIDRGLEDWTAAAILSLIGLFNIFGSLLSGYLSAKMSKKIIYNLKIDDADLNHAVRTFVVASNYILSNSPKKPTISPSSISKFMDLTA